MKIKQARELKAGDLVKRGSSALIVTHLSVGVGVSIIATDAHTGAPANWIHFDTERLYQVLDHLSELEG